MSLCPFEDPAVGIGVILIAFAAAADADAAIMLFC
jgi:hypothetical protein